MPAHFETLRDQLTTDIVTALGFEADDPVKFGRPRKPIRATRYAVVLTSVARQNVGRQVQEQYNFTIGLYLPLPDPQVQDIDSYLFAKADLLVDRLAPFDTVAPPAGAGSYAGVGSQRRVTSVTPGEDEDNSSWCSVVVEFSCMCTVYQ